MGCLSLRLGGAEVLQAEVPRPVVEEWAEAQALGVERLPEADLEAA